MPASTTRSARTLSTEELKIREWIARNNGVLTRVAKELSVSVTMVNRVAYYLHETKSQDYRVEKRLLALGCPLMQRIPR